MGGGQAPGQAELTSGDTLGSARPGSGAPDRRRQNKASVSPGYSGSRTPDRAQGQDAGPGRKRPDTTLTPARESLKHAGGVTRTRGPGETRRFHWLHRSGPDAAGEQGLGLGRDRGIGRPTQGGRSMGQAGGPSWDGRLPASGPQPSAHPFRLKFILVEANYFTILWWLLPYTDVTCRGTRIPHHEPPCHLLPSHPSGSPQCTGP